MRTSLALSALLLSSLWVTAPGRVAFAQHQTASDLLDGERAFRSNCANCHGPDGDQIAGIDLGRGRFRRPMTDDDLVRIIRTGIPNTGMPATSMTVEQAQNIVGYLRMRAAEATAGSVTGDAARGKTVFEGKGACLSCHRVDGVGSRVGPDLSGAGALRGAADLRMSLLDPNAEVAPANRFYKVVLKDGTAVEGRLLSHDTFTVQMIDTHENLRSFVKGDLRSFGFIPSPMPSYRGTLTDQEIADLVSYLASLRER
ncbi:MAG TPA: c-type cytochrome [Vicinamibacterales bacterium]|nr:c-type cytochrome [Vicinamibacterales bacterium]